MFLIRLILRLFGFGGKEQTEYRDRLNVLESLYLEQYDWLERGVITQMPGIADFTQDYVDELSLDTTQSLAVINESGLEVNWLKVESGDYRDVAAEVLAIGLAQANEIHQPNSIEVEGRQVPVAAAFSARFVKPRKPGANQVEIVNL